MMETTGRSGCATFTPSAVMKPQPKRALEARRDVGVRRQHGIREVGGEARLAQLLHQDAVARQRPADRSQVVDVRLHRRRPSRRSAFAWQPPRPSAGPGRVGSCQAPRAGRSAASAASATMAMSGRRRRISAGSMSTRMTRGRRRDLLHQRHHAGPAHGRHLEPRADPEQHVRLRPQQRGGVGGDAERMVLRHDAAPAAEGGHGGVQRVRQRLDRGGRVLGAAAHHDHRALRLARAAAAACSMSGGGGAVGAPGALRGGGHPLGAGHGIPRHLHRDRAGPAGQHLPERLLDDRRRVRRALDAGGPFHQRSQGAELVRQLVQVAAATAQELRRDLAGDAQHGRVAAPRRCTARPRCSARPGPAPRRTRRAARSSGRSRMPCSRRPARAARRSW